MKSGFLDGKHGATDFGWKKLVPPNRKKTGDLQL